MPNRVKDFSVTASIPAADDFLLVDGAVNGTRKLAGSALIQAYIGRKLADGVYFDGAGTPRAVWPLGSVGALSGQTKTVAGLVYIPTAAEISGISWAIWSIGGSSSLAPAASGDGITLVLNTNGSPLFVRQYGPTAGDVKRWNSDNNPTTLFGGRVVPVVLVLKAGQAPEVYICGISFAGTVQSDVGAPNAWGTHSCAYFQLGGSGGSSSARGLLGAPVVINGELSAAEILTHAITGRLPTWCEVGAGSAVNKITNTSRNADFSAGVTDWAGVAGGTCSVVSGALNVSLPATATDRVDLAASNYGNWVAGRKYRLTATISNLVGTIRFRVGATNLLIGNVSADGSVAFEFTSDTSSGAANLQITPTTNNSSATVDNIVVQELGPVFKPVIRSGRVLPDQSGNKIHGVMTAGAIPLTDDMHGTVVQTALTANGELIDTAGIIPTDASFEDLVVRNTSANPVYGFAVAMTSGGDEITYRTDILAGATVILPIKRADAAGLTTGTYTAQGATFGRLYYSATDWNSGSLNISVRYRRERGI